LALYQGDYPAARRYIEQGLALARREEEKTGNCGPVEFLVYSLSQVALKEGDYDRATALAEEERALILGMGGDRYSFCHPLGTLGRAAMLRGDYEQAARHFQDMAALAREGERPWDLAAALQGLGSAKEKQADYQQAAALFTESLAIFKEFGSKPRVARCLRH